MSEVTAQTTDENPEPVFSERGAIAGYRVEARYNFSEPREFGGQILDKEWRLLHFPEGRHVGVPIGDAFMGPILRQCSCFSYQGAQALRWWFHAEMERELLGAICLETRIVKYSIEYSHSATRVSEHGWIGGEDRSNCIPDWGK